MLATRKNHRVDCTRSLHLRGIPMRALLTLAVVLGLVLVLADEAAAQFVRPPPIPPIVPPPRILMPPPHVPVIVHPVPSHISKAPPASKPTPPRSDSTAAARR